MAALKKGRNASATSKPWRSLALILIAIVALTGGMFASGHTTPRLGIDLAGGTSITLAAVPEAGQESAINKTNMDTAVSIMERRVNGLGVSEAEVQTQGDRNIIVNIPKGTNSKQAREQVGTTAKLYFRPVIATELAEGGAAPQPSATGEPSAAPSGDKADDKAGDKGDKATDGASEKATDGSSASADPSASATTQGRAVTDALKADESPAATDKASPSPSATGGASDDPDAKLQAEYAKLDCTKESVRATAGDGAKATESTVACGQNSQGQWQKYILGPAAVDGTDVDEADAVLNTQSGAGWTVTMKFTGEGSKKFADITGQLAQKQSPQNQFAIVLDGEVVSDPYVRQALTGGNAEISGNFNQQSAQELANMLSYGALPLTFREDSVTTVTAALGGEQLQAGLIAGAIGLALVILYLLFYYRGLSFIAVASLMVSAALTYVIMALLGPTIGFALNLPAVCGAIVAIGITADSFIVYFERVRDEIREGRSLRPSVERAWPRARRTILVSDFVSFLAAAVLFVVTVGKVQGFAFTLGLTTVLDVVVVFLFTKPLLTLMARRKFFASGHKWSGLDPKALGAKPPLRRTRRPSAPAQTKEA
ncbi:protein translocase subunit SecD [Streptomyces cellulosae]|uniref:Protein translocase subunit SecD n=1 Tax=Streptomyces thermodiastaticus TaxID=44061 RepID=A0ABU0KCH7_9ACTN|nr:protein translocase subunit SecD [Streptomyces sp. McG7]MBT2902482.1 protein translocase subunit SecD [Streptomyces sp. McG8]MCX4475936.1 protein translocase subunit SecD [Streptomyces cellulosae]MDQ0487085.1 preprotein translocase subunit SecD [Streptomyces thermodiastaticus]MDX3414097.1 protein translocase subunit SecD [Streptomyces sp. MD20-1-1]MXQ60365.1 protein translocase subunit SecD [Streptomyces sp. XHT-2]MYQ35936.1 protein translocase subunit SecD [Streptomyces sp. SID4956]THC58